MLGQSLGVAAWNNQLQGQFEQLVVLERIAAHLEEAVADAFAMSCMVGGVGGRVGGFSEFVFSPPHSRRPFGQGIEQVAR